MISGKSTPIASGGLLSSVLNKRNEIDVKGSMQLLGEQNLSISGAYVSQNKDSETTDYSSVQFSKALINGSPNKIPCPP